MNLVTLNDRLIIERDEMSEFSPGGIELPGNKHKKSSRGTVMVVGPGKLLENGQRADMAVREGDVVIFSDYSGTEIEVQKQKLVVLAEHEVLVILPQPKKGKKK